MTKHGYLAGAVTAALLCLAPWPAPAAELWRAEVEALAARLAPAVPVGKAAFVGEFRDASGEDRYYPFVEGVRRAFVGALGAAGAAVAANPAQAEVFATVAFRVESGGLGLDAQVRSLWDSRVLGSASAQVPEARLPATWRQRTLQDVARELSRKLQDALVGDRVTLAVGEFAESGAAGEPPAYLEAVRLEVRQQLASAPAFALVESTAAGAGRVLTGVCVPQGEEVVIEVRVASSQAGESPLASATARFPRALADPARPRARSFVFHQRGDGAERVAEALGQALRDRGYPVYDEGVLGAPAPDASAQAVLAAAAESPAGYLVRIAVDVPQEPGGALGNIKTFPATALLKLADLSSGQVLASAEESQTLFGLTRSQALQGQHPNHLPKKIVGPLVERFLKAVDGLGLPAGEGK